MAELKPDKAKLIWQLSFEGAWPTSVAFLDGGSKVAAGNRDGQILLWDLTKQPAADDSKAEKSAATKKDETAPNLPPIRQLLGHTNGISHLVSTDDGKWLISASLDRSIRIWDVNAAPSGSTEIVLDRGTREREAKQLPTDKREAFLNAPGVKIETQTATQTLEGHRDWINSLGISRDGKRLISGDVTSLVIVWDLAARKEISRWTGHPWNWAFAAALSPDGQTALVSEYRYKRDDFDIPPAALKLWNVADGSEKLDILKTQFPKLDPKSATYGSASVWRKFVANGLIATDFSPDGKLLAAGQGGETGTGKVHIFEAATGKLLRSIAGHQNGVTDVKFSADGKYVLSTGRDTSLQICQVADGKEVAKLGKARGGQFKDWFHAVAVSPDQKRLATADIAGIVHVWSLDE